MSVLLTQVLKFYFYIWVWYLDEDHIIFKKYSFVLFPTTAESYQWNRLALDRERRYLALFVILNVHYTVKSVIRITTSYIIRSK